MARTQATPIVGTNAVVELVPEAGGSVITLKNSDWEITPSNGVAEAPNTTDGMVRAPGLADYMLTVKGSVDATSTSTAIEAQAKPGAIYAFKAYRSKGSNLFYAGTLIIKSLKVGTGSTTVENWNLDAAKCYGNLVLPDGSTL